MPREVCTLRTSDGVLGPNTPDILGCKEHLQNLEIEAVCVLQYHNRAVQISETGSMKLIENVVEVKKDGLTMGQPEQKRLAGMQPLRSGGNPNAATQQKGITNLLRVV